jgi:hypothetical protein
LDVTHQGALNSASRNSPPESFIADSTLDNNSILLPQCEQSAWVNIPGVWTIHRWDPRT